MRWIDFVALVHQELAKGDLFSDFRSHFADEQALTRSVGMGLRKLFALSHNLPIDSDELYDFVTFRSVQPLAGMKCLVPAYFPICIPV